jgi:hypothetical protein
MSVERDRRLYVGGEDTHFQRNRARGDRPELSGNLLTTSDGPAGFLETGFGDGVPIPVYPTIAGSGRVLAF